MTDIQQKVRSYAWQFEGRTIRLGIGCSAFGQGYEGAGELPLLEQCYEMGFRYFDTSRSYGESELVVGNLLRQIDRKTVFVATKSRFPFQEADGFEQFKRNFYESFTRLQTDYIDLFQIHDTNNYRVCAGEVIPFLEARRDEGIIGAFGLGTRSQKAHQNGIAGKRIFSSLSYLDYNLLKTSAAESIALSRKHGTAFINGSVMYFGLLKSPDPMSMDFGAPVKAFAVKMQALCKEIGADISAASLQFSLLNPDIDMTLIGIKRQSNLDNVLQAMRHPLFPEQWAAIAALQNECADIHIEAE